MKKQLLLAATLGVCSLSAFANYTQLTLGLGANTGSLNNLKYQTPNNLNLTVTSKGGNQTQFTPSLSDTFHLTFSKAWDWEIGLQYIFAPKDKWYPKAQDTTQNHYQYDIYKLTSNILLANTGFGFHPSKRIELSAFAGIGTSHNKIKGDLRTSATPGGSFNLETTYKSHSTWQFAWDVGANMDYDLSKSWAIGLSYQYIQGGKANTGFDNTNGTIKTKTKINRQVYLATLSYIFNRTGNSV